MISANTADPLSTGSIGLSNYRSRPVDTERSVLPDSTPPAPANSSASDFGKFPQRESYSEPAELPRRDPSSMFAAAVIAGALSPTPQTMEQLMLRIGTSTIPEESEARLKDLLV